MMSKRILIPVILLLAIGILWMNFHHEDSSPIKEQPDPNQAPSGQTSVTPTPETSKPMTDNSNLKLPNHNSKPDLNTDNQGLSRATVWMETNKGLVKYKFYSKDAPNTVNRMIELMGQGFYNGLTFHRVEPGFVVQGGDPRGNGTGGSGKNLKAEFNKRRHTEGTVAMARAGDPDSADSQFYICLGTFPHLDNQYTVFGQVIEGMDVVRKIQPGDKMLKVIVE